MKAIITLSGCPFIVAHIEGDRNENGSCTVKLELREAGSAYYETDPLESFRHLAGEYKYSELPAEIKKAAAKTFASGGYVGCSTFAALMFSDCPEPWRAYQEDYWKKLKERVIRKLDNHADLLDAAVKLGISL
jgi:hypothetical protein